MSGGGGGHLESWQRASYHLQRRPARPAEFRLGNPDIRSVVYVAGKEEVANGKSSNNGRENMTSETVVAQITQSFGQECGNVRRRRRHYEWEAAAHRQSSTIPKGIMMKQIQLVKPWPAVGLETEADIPRSR